MQEAKKRGTQVALNMSSQVGLLCLGRKSWRDEERCFPQAQGSTSTDESAVKPAHRAGHVYSPAKREGTEGPFWRTSFFWSIGGRKKPRYRGSQGAHIRREMCLRPVYLSMVLCFQALVSCFLRRP